MKTRIYLENWTKKMGIIMVILLIKYLNIYWKVVKRNERKIKKWKHEKKTTKEKNVEEKLSNCPGLIPLILEGHSVHVTCEKARKQFNIKIACDYIKHIKYSEFNNTK